MNLITEKPTSVESDAAKTRLHSVRGGPFLFAHAVAAGEPTARALCMLMAVFWSMRLAAAGFIFDVWPYLRNWFYRIGYHGRHLVFVYLVAVYALAAWKGGAS